MRSEVAVPIRPAPGAASAGHAEVPRDPTPAGLTVKDFARRYRVGEDKVRAWIRSRELRAVNTAAALCGRPRWVILPEALAEFERRRQAAPPPRSRRRRRTTQVDYYPDP
jgi:hypothetical protein